MIKLDLRKCIQKNSSSSMIIFLERVEILEQSTLQTQMTLGGLDKYQNYSVRVAAATRVGQGLKSRSIYCRTLEDGSAHNLLIVFQLFKIFAHIFRFQCRAGRRT